MNNFQVIITKGSNNLFSAFSIDYPIAIEEKTEKKAFDVISAELKHLLINELKANRKIVKPKEYSFKSIEAVIKNYEIGTNAYIVKTINIPLAFSEEENITKAERVNVSIPKYLKRMAEAAGTSISKVTKLALEKEFGIS